MPLLTLEPFTGPKMWGCDSMYRFFPNDAIQSFALRFKITPSETSTIIDPAKFVHRLQLIADGMVITQVTSDWIDAQRLRCLQESAEDGDWIYTLFLPMGFDPSFFPGQHPLELPGVECQVCLQLGYIMGDNPGTIRACELLVRTTPYTGALPKYLAPSVKRCYLKDCKIAEHSTQDIYADHKVDSIWVKTTQKARIITLECTPDDARYHTPLDMVGWTYFGIDGDLNTIDVKVKYPVNVPEDVLTIIVVQQMTKIPRPAVRKACPHCQCTCQNNKE